ncbi:MAG: DegT/DnrJ/EryC1/StrS family aminotransferase [Bacteroidales bacterium]|nr:DegT/DnrJ/EryC1/StrS family aminotransferase [Bacteroidales bacterium]
MRYPFLNLATVNAPYMDQLQEATRRVVASGWYVGGPECQRFEENMATLANVSHCVGVSNGLDALRLIFRGFIEQGRLQPSDKVLVPANTYIASVLAVTDAGLEPVFVEPRLDTLNIDPERVLKAAGDPAVKALLTVHLYGRVAWDERYNALAERLLIVEDVAQAIGAVSRVPGINGTHAAGSLGHAAGFSFYPTKNIGALGDAGCVTTNNPQLARTVRALANYGSFQRYHNEYEGFNCRLDPLQAACINVKLPHTRIENDIRRQLARVYDENIHNQLITKPLFVDSDEMVWHQYVILSPERDRLRDYLTDNGVGTDINYPTPPHRQPCYQRYSHLSLPVATQIAHQCLSLPITRCTSPAAALAISRLLSSFPS